MAFKQFSQYVEDKNGMFFVLPNDRDTADVIFLYQSAQDVLIADAHYLTTNQYSGYAHCCGAGCPACNYGDRGIRKQDKLFIPLLNLTKNKIEFWDRNPRFEQVLQSAVFANYANPSEYVFRITRQGEAGDRNTRYQIVPIGRNTGYPYEKILADYGMKLPEGYDNVCREMSAEEMSSLLSSTAPSAELENYDFVPVPRGTGAADLGSAPDLNIPTPTYSAPPTDLPGMDITNSSSVPDDLPDIDVSGPAEEIAAQVDEVSADSEDDTADSLDDVKF